MSRPAPIPSRQKVGVFGEKSVAGVDRVRAALPSRRKDSIDPQIALAGPAVHGDGAVGEGYMQRARVRFGRPRCPQAKCAATAYDARDLAAMAIRIF